MKKFTAVMATVGAAACLCACGCHKDKTDYDALNNMLAVNYSQVTLTVTDTFGEDLSLVSEYKMSYSDGEITVSYSIERLKDISLDTAVAEKSTVTGQTVIVDGVCSDENVSAVLSDSGLSFKSEYFNNASSSDGHFSADVKNASAFFGSAIVCTNMKVSADFSDKFETIKITYTAKNGNTVQYNYAFVK